MFEIVSIDPDSLLEERLHLMWKAFMPHRGKEAATAFAASLAGNRAVIAARHQGQLAAMVCVKEQFENRIRGANLAFGGIGEVSTLPEYRRDRLIRRIYDKIFEVMNQQEIVYSALGPFSFPFYEKFGYAHAARHMLYQFDSQQIRSIKVKSGFRWREYRDEDADAVLQAQRSMARFGSRVFVLQKQLKNDHAYVLEREGQVQAFIRFMFKEEGEHESSVSVDQTWFTHDDCLPAILDMVSRYGAQSSRISWSVDPEIPLEYYLKEPGMIERQRQGSMMVRVVKFRQFCQQIKVPLYAAEAVTIRLEDENCPWNTGTYRLTPVSGRLEVEPGTKEPEITFDALHFSHAVGGFLTANRLRRLGALHCSLEAAERFTRIFPPESFVTYAWF